MQIASPFYFQSTDFSVFFGLHFRNINCMYKQQTKIPYIVCYLCAFVLGMKQLNNPDIWWHLVSGRWMEEHSAIINTDVFAQTIPTGKWINAAWLYEVVVGILAKGLGPLGIMLLQCLVNVGIVLLLLRTLQLFAQHTGRQISTLFSTLGIILMLGISEFRMGGGAEIAGHILMVTYLLILWKGDYSWKKIWWLILLQCVWANMHQSYYIGILMTLTYILGGGIAMLRDKNREQKQGLTRLSIVFVAMIAATLLNPNGGGIFKLAFATNGKALNIEDLGYWTLQTTSHHILAGLVMAYWLYKIAMSATGKSPMKFTPLLLGYLLWLPVAECLSFASNMYLPFAQFTLFLSVPFVLTDIVALAKLNTKTFYLNAAKRTVIISSVVAGIFYVSVVSNSLYKATASTSRYGLHISAVHNPVGAADFIRNLGLPGPAFSDHTVSPYLLWELYPEYKSFINLQAAKAYPERTLKAYTDLNANPSKFYYLDSVNKFNYLVLNTSELSALKQMLYWGESFNVVHVDPMCVIFLLNNDANRSINNGSAASKLFTWPEAPEEPGWTEALTKLFNPTVTYEEEDPMYEPMYAAKFYNSVRNSRISMRMLKPAIMGDLSEDAEALALMGQSYYMFTDFANNDTERKTRFDSAKIFFDKALEINPNEYQAHMGLGTLELIRGSYAKAKQHFGEAIKLPQANELAFYFNGLCARNLWKANGSATYLDETVKSMERSATMDKGNEKAYLYLAEAYNAKKNIEQARKNMLKLTASDLPLSKEENELFEQLKKQTGVNPPLQPKQIIPEGHEHHHH